MYAIYILFIFANMIMIPLGWATIKVAQEAAECSPGNPAAHHPAGLHCRHVRHEQFAFDVGIMLVAGVVAFLEENDFPVAPAILGVVLGPMLEENFVKSMIKADGEFAFFFAGRLRGVLGVMTLLVWTYPLLRWLWPRRAAKGRTA